MLKNKNDEPQLLEGSRAIARTIQNIQPGVVSAYPITPQTHIVEDLARFRAEGESDFEYLRAESEFAAASIVLGASAAGARVYSATSSQGLMLMTEVVYNIAGLRLPVVMTVANRAISGPINIWNDHSDIMSVRDSGWLQLFAENNQEAIEQHLLAYKLAESLKLPVFVNVDGFILTHSYEGVRVPTREEIIKYLPDYRPEAGSYLNTANPVTMGAFFTPENYQEARLGLHADLKAAATDIKKEYSNFRKSFPRRQQEISDIDNGLVEYWGPQNPEIIVVAMGSVIGTIREACKRQNKKVGVLKIKVFRPFPEQELKSILTKAKKIIVVEKAVSPGAGGQLFLEIRGLTEGKIKISSYISGLGGRDVREKEISKMLK